jgi:hypothetical protein
VDINFKVVAMCCVCYLRRGYLNDCLLAHISLGERVVSDLNDERKFSLPVYSS